MTDREALAAAVADRPREETARLAFADWFDDHGQPGRGAYIRAACAADRSRPGSEERAGHLDRADDLLAEHEADWLGPWRDRLVDWEYRRGVLHRVRMTAADFLRDGGGLLRSEPVGAVELVSGETGRLADDHLSPEAVREVIAHPAFGLVRRCVVSGRFQQAPVGVWLAALAANPRLGRLRHFGPDRGRGFQSDGSDGVDERAVRAFAAAPHLHHLRSLDLTQYWLPDGTERGWLVPVLAGAGFARSLRRLDLTRCGVGAAGLGVLAAEPALGGLRELRVDGGNDPAGRAAVYNSRTLTAVRSFSVEGEHLPEYARSPMAVRVRDLTVNWHAEDAEWGGDAAGWPELVDAAPPPRRLVLRNHNPGPAAFRAMRQAGWLRRVRDLDISGDSQSGSYRTSADVGRLFRPGVLPRLTRLRLHELGNRSLLGQLAEWPGMARLESLELTDDYHGRFTPADFEPRFSPDRLRTLTGVIVSSDDEAERFLALPGLERLSRLNLSFSADYDRTARRYVPRLTPVAAERVVRSDRLANVTDLRVGFNAHRAVAWHVWPLLADPAVMPRLKTVRLYVMQDGASGDRPSRDGLVARFGPRVEAR